MANQKDHYRLLQVSRTADLNTIKQAYRDKIRQYHPDRLTGERARLRRGDDPQALRELERQITEAKRMTQQLNAAYAVLSDSKRRRQYDEWLADENSKKASQTVDEWRRAHPDYGRRSVKSRPHRNPHRPPTLVEEATPWAMIVGLFIALVIISYLIRGFLLNVESVQQARPTAIGLNANEIQATQNMVNATEIIRTQRAVEPTNTPRPLLAILEAGDALYDTGNFAYAVEQYDAVIAGDVHLVEAYYKRGQAYAAIYAETNDEVALGNALLDYAQALDLDATYGDALRARGLLYYARWQVTDDAGDAANALADLEAYQQQTGRTDTTVNEALEALPQS